MSKIWCTVYCPWLFHRDRVGCYLSCVSIGYPRWSSSIFFVFKEEIFFVHQICFNESLPRNQGNMFMCALGGRGDPMLIIHTFPPFHTDTPTRSTEKARANSILFSRFQVWGLRFKKVSQQISQSPVLTVFVPTPWFQLDIGDLGRFCLYFSRFLNPKNNFVLTDILLIKWLEMRG